MIYQQIKFSKSLLVKGSAGQLRIAGAVRQIETINPAAEWD